MYNLVEGLGPAKQKRSVKVKQFNDCETRNILDRHTTEKKKKKKKKKNNNRGYIVELHNTKQLKQSFFGRTVAEWYHLDTATMRADANENFTIQALLTSQLRLSHTIAKSLSPQCATLKKPYAVFIQMQIQTECLSSDTVRVCPLCAFDTYIVVNNPILLLTSI